MKVPTPMTPPRTFTPGKLQAGASYASAVIFGDSGAGKTTLLGTAPKPMLVINIDNSLGPLVGMEGIDVLPDPSSGRPVQSWEEALAILDWIEAGGAKGYATIAWDTVSELGYLLQKHILSKPGRTNRVSATAMSQSDWGEYADEYLPVLRRLRDLRAMHFVVVTSQTDDLLVTDPAGGSQLIRFADFGGGQKVPKTAPALFDMAGFLGVDTRKDGSLVRKLLVQPLANRRAKIRTKAGVEAPAMFENPNLTEIFKIVGA